MYMYVYLKSNLVITVPADGIACKQWTLPQYIQ